VLYILGTDPSIRAAVAGGSVLRAADHVTNMLSASNVLEQASSQNSGPTASMNHR
jgi:hypothetical protein